MIRVYPNPLKCAHLDESKGGTVAMSSSRSGSSVNDIVRRVILIALTLLGPVSASAQQESTVEWRLRKELVSKPALPILGDMDALRHDLCLFNNDKFDNKGSAVVTNDRVNSVASA